MNCKCAKELYLSLALSGRVVKANRDHPTCGYVKRVMKACWSIEVCHWKLKQICGIECCQTPIGRVESNQIFRVISAWFQKYRQRLKYKTSFYQQDSNRLKSSISRKIKLILVSA